jgi:hypothetical protein
MKQKYLFVVKLKTENRNGENGGEERRLEKNLF